MKRKSYIKICYILVVLIAVIFVLYHGKGGKEEISQSVSEIQEPEVQEQEEKDQGEEDGSREKDSAEVEKSLTEEQEQGEELFDENGLEEFWLREEKIELTDFAELPIEEFIKETEIPLYQEEEGKWRTEDNSISAKTDNGKIVCLVLSDYTGDAAKDEELEQLIETKGFPYTIAGIHLHDNVTHLENTVLKTASRVSSGGIGRDYYTSLELSRLGIERLTLEEIGETVGGVTVDLDMSLKESAEGLEYIWGEKVRQKEGEKNDRLTVPEDLYTEIPENYKQPGNIEKTIVSIKYPCLEIPGKLEMEQNVNSLILEEVEKIEDETYRKTDENIVVEADYFMTYITSKFISITFRVKISDNDGTRMGPWQHCNINMAKNGAGATLADVGITREDVAIVCGAYREPLDTEAYLEKYDTGWDHYVIEPMEYILYVPVKDEESEQQDEGGGAPVRKYKY